MPAQVNIFLLLFGGMQAILLSILLFKKGRNLPGYFFLASYLIVMTLQIILKVMSKIWLMESMRPLYGFSYQLPLLYGPLVYLFIRETTGQARATAKDILHFLPTILVIPFFITWDPSIPRQEPRWLMPLFDNRWALSIQLVSLFVYHLAAFRWLKKFQQVFSNLSNGVMAYRNAWLSRFVGISFIVCSCIAILIAFLYYWYPRYQDLRFGFAVLTLFIYWISYKALSQPEIFGIVRGSGTGADNSQSPTVFTVHHAVKKYSNSPLQTDDLQAIIIEVCAKMQEEKLYLSETLTIDNLAAATGYSRHHLSQALNEYLGKSFNDFINQYRIEETKSVLKDPAMAAYKISSIAFDAGFNSISSFNEVFKKWTGLTPSQYRKQEVEKILQKQRV